MAFVRASGLIPESSDAEASLAARSGRDRALLFLNASVGLSLSAIESLTALAALADRPGPPALGIPVSLTGGRRRPGSVDPSQGGQRQVLASRYDLVLCIGKGGMGEVWLGRDLELGRQVAVKFLRVDQSGSASARKRFADEARLVAQLEHPVIPPIHDSGMTPEGIPFFVMRLVESGKDLHDALALARPVQRRIIESGLPPPSPGATALDKRPWSDESLATRFRRAEVLHIVRLVAQCVAAAHARGVLHRDIKPSNIMIGAMGEPLLLDWGLAKAIGTADTAPPPTGSINLPRGNLTRGPLGTPGFASPEQARGETLDERADVYSLGAVLYQALTYELPFPGIKDFGAQLAAQQQAGPTPPSLRTTWARIPPSLDAICLQAMAFHKEDRHDSVLDFVDDLSAFLEGRLEAERKQKASSAAVERARNALEERRRALAILPAIERAATRLQAETPRDWSLDQKGKLFAAQDRLHATQRKIRDALDESVEAYLSALDDDPDNSDISLELAELAWSQLTALDELDRPPAREIFHWRALLKSHGCGLYDARMQGDGTLRVETTPPGAKATLFWVKPAGAVLEKRNPHVLGLTPTRAVSLPMGNYHIEIASEGQPTIHYPVRMKRTDHQVARVPLQNASAIPPGFAFIPESTCILGGDPELPRHLQRPRTSTHVESFAIARVPVTCGQYLEFLDSLPLEQAIPRAPQGATGGPFWLHDEHGKWSLPRGPAPFCDRDWDERWPVVSVSFADAKAFAAWYSEKQDRAFDLPTNDQWEKAARGVDGRFYPWGNHFDSTLANLPVDHSRRGAIEPVGSYPRDRSPYGVLDLAGNAIDLVQLIASEDERLCGARGGGWHVRNLLSRSAAHAQIKRTDRHVFVTFRLVTTI